MTFGNFSYWHLIPGAPRNGSIEHRAKYLLDLWHADRVAELTPAEPRKATDILRAMALELAVASLSERPGVPTIVVDLVEAVCPQWITAVFDPAWVYSGHGAGRGAHPTRGQRRMRSIAMHFDIEHAKGTGNILPATELARKLKETIVDTPDLRKGVTEKWGADEPDLAKTIRVWRKDKMYADGVDAARLMYLKRDLAP